MNAHERSSARTHTHPQTHLTMCRQTRTLTRARILTTRARASGWLRRLIHGQMRAEAKRAADAFAAACPCEHLFLIMTPCIY
mmetsp:Transcript_42803/g.93801  ORF Transcript_42803/g.93801 Transcript_42803/m.93801 type:complete len:82 (+) Transcript_42803:837-1082(+)